MSARKEKQPETSNPERTDLTRVRSLNPGCYEWQSKEVAVKDWGDHNGIRTWLAAEGRQIGARWLLAFADDGVIWGRFNDDGTLDLSSDHAPDVSPPLLPETLQELRAFGAEAELLLWRSGPGEWKARILRDATREGQAKCWYYDEHQILWGTQGELVGNSGFTLMTDGEQGMQHVVPLEADGNWNVESRPLRLTVRHYVEADDNGLLRVVASRLVTVYKSQQGGNNDDQKDSETAGARESQQ